MFTRRKQTESYGETRSSEWGNFSADIRCRSSAKFPGATHRLGSLPAASWSLTSKRHRCMKTHPLLMSTGVWSMIPLGPDLLPTLFRGTLKWKGLHLCETSSWILHQTLVYWRRKESFTSCTPCSTCPHLHWPFWCCIIHRYFRECTEILSSVSSNCILKTLFSIFLSVVSDVRGHLELATTWGTAWGRTFLVWVLWSLELYSLLSHGLCEKRGWKDKENFALHFENTKYNISMKQGMNFSGINIPLLHHGVEILL